MKFEGCCAVACVRQSVGPKVFSQYLIEENCRYAQQGICTYKRHEKIERKQNGIPEPIKS